MLFPTHVAASYLTTRAYVRRVVKSASWSLLAIGIFAGVVPDVDAVWFYAKYGRAATGDLAGAHRLSIMHTPFLCVIVVALILAIPHKASWSSRVHLAACSAIGFFTHLVLDSLTIGWGIMWLYPFSTRMYGWNIVTRLYRRKWGDRWFIEYLHSPFILIELTIVVLAFGVWLKDRRSRAAQASGTEHSGSPEPP
jgi:membrane-bound metal-dependent hydrolase YbcI (DUF457 family)